MDAQCLQEYRVQRLHALVQKEGGKAALGRKLGYRDGAFIGQMLRGERPITEKTIGLVNNLPGRKGWFEHLAKPHAVAEKEPQLPDSLAIVAAAIRKADDLTLDQVRPLLVRLVDTPDRAQEIVPRLSALLA